MAISTKKKQKAITKDDILALVDDYQIFRMNLGEFPINRKFKNPFYSDKNGSCIIRNYDGVLIMADYGEDRWNGDCFNMIKHAYNCNYNEALRKVDQQFGLGLFNGETHLPLIKYIAPDIQPAKPSKIFTSASAISKAGDEYLAKYHLTLEDMNFCKDTKVSWLNELVINYRHEYVGKLGIEYKLKNERGAWRKICRPFASEDNKWRSNIPNIEMHGVGNIKDCETGIIIKSMKDGAFINKYILRNVEIIQYENYYSLTEENKKRLKQSCKKLYISFDNDPTGVKECKRLTTEMECGYINPPKRLLEKGITDFTDWAAATNPQTVIDYWKSKNIIL